ncbi:MAG: DUF169 domain-containing protein [Desulfobacterales bacterium]|jgi:uncharacterized protein (DUF169 family)
MLNANITREAGVSRQIDTAKYLNDVELAEELLANASQNGGQLSHADIVFSLRNFLKMKYYPVAIKYFFSEQELQEFKNNVEYKTALHPYTFCHYVAASRQRGDILLGTSEKLGCSNAKYVMAWKELDDTEVKSHLKYARDWDQAKRFVETKKRLPEGLRAFVTAPLHKAPYTPDVIHGVSDVLQAYHLGNDWCAAYDMHPFEMTMTMNSSVCHGCVQCQTLRQPNITPMCSSSKTAGKTEQGEINWIWPGDQLESTVRWMLQRIVRDGGVSFPRTGETYPGFDVCKLCNFLVFRKPKERKK